jgi:hypothetical protein
LSASLVTINKRSTKGVSRLSSSERKQILMPNDIKDVLIGILLGDAHIVKRSSTGNSRLVYAQTALLIKRILNMFTVSLLLSVLITTYHNLELLEIIELKK